MNSTRKSIEFFRKQSIHKHISKFVLPFTLIHEKPLATKFIRIDIFGEITAPIFNPKIGLMSHTKC